MIKPIDLRIGATQNYNARAGETLALELTVKDKDKVDIDLTNFTVGPFKIFSYSSNNVLLEIPTSELVISGAKITINKLIPLATKANMEQGNFFECPFLPPGGGPVAIYDGRIYINAKN
jgi:hypothetical protein